MRKIEEESRVGVDQKSRLVQFSEEMRRRLQAVDGNSAGRADLMTEFATDYLGIDVDELMMAHILKTVRQDEQTGALRAHLVGQSSSPVEVEMWLQGEKHEMSVGVVRRLGGMRYGLELKYLSDGSINWGQLTHGVLKPDGSGTWDPEAGNAFIRNPFEDEEPGLIGATDGTLKALADKQLDFAGTMTALVEPDQSEFNFLVMTVR